MSPMRYIAFLAVALASPTASLGAAPRVYRQNGLHILENELVRAEVKHSELYRLTHLATGRELMSPGWHGVLNLCAKGRLPGGAEDTWLFQDSYSGNRVYKIEAGSEQATLSVSVDWVRRPAGQAPYYSVRQEITIFRGKPYLRVRYAIVAKQPPDPAPASFMIQSCGTVGTHLVEPGGRLRVEELTVTRLGGMATDPASYWFAFLDGPSGHFVAFLRPGQTDPSSCMYAKGQWYVSRWSEPFLGSAGQSHREELWIVAGRADGGAPETIADAAQAAYAFANRRDPILATLLRPYVTHQELVRRTAHLRADGKGNKAVYRDERLYVDGMPFLFSAPWGIDQDMWENYKKYHLTGVFGAVRNADLAHKHGLKIVPSALEWPRRRGPDLEQHIRQYVDHPAIVAWFLQDDFGGDLDMLGNIEIIRAVDPHRPTVADVVGYDADRRRASAFLDINSPYTYPAPVHTYRWYADYLEHNQKIMERQFNWTCPQAASYSAFARTGQSPALFLDYPTAAQMRLQTYVGLAHGIRGFMYWPVSGLRDYKLSELGIACAEIEAVTDLIVEAERNDEGAAADNGQVEVQRLDAADCTLLFLINYREKSERWPTGELAPRFAVTVERKSVPQMQVHSFTLDQDLAVAAPVADGEDLKLDVAGLDIAALVILAQDTPHMRRRTQQLKRLDRELTEFAATTNRYTARKVHGLLRKLGGMRAPSGRAARLYNEAVGRIERETTFTAQRRAARILRNAMGEALAQADGLSDYAPLYAQKSLLINVWTLPQFMASFNFRALREETMGELTDPPAIEPMKPVPERGPAQPVEVGKMLLAKEAEGTFEATLEAANTYCLVQHAPGRALHVFPGPEPGRRSRGEFVGLPNDNLDLCVALVRPDDGVAVRVATPKGAKAFGVLPAASLAEGAELQGPVLTAANPVAAYDVPGTKGDSFEVALRAAEGCVADLLLCQAHPRHGQVLASGRTAGSKPLSLRCTLPDAAPLTLVVERVKGGGTHWLGVTEVDTPVLPRRAVNPFAGVRFALYGTDTCNFPGILASHWISGDQLMGKLAEASLRQVDVLILLTNAIKYDEADELQANADRLKAFVERGGSMVVFQQNGRETWDSSPLPYPMQLVLSATKVEPVLADDWLFAGVKPADVANGSTVAYYPVNMAETDPRWRCLAYADQAKTQGAMAACRYGKGRVVVNQFAVLDRIGEPVMRSLMVDTVRYVLREE